MSGMESHPSSSTLALSPVNSVLSIGGSRGSIVTTATHDSHCTKTSADLSTAQAPLRGPTVNIDRDEQGVPRRVSSLPEAAVKEMGLAKGRQEEEQRAKMHELELALKEACTRADESEKYLEKVQRDLSSSRSERDIMARQLRSAMKLNEQERRDYAMVNGWYLQLLMQVQAQALVLHDVEQCLNLAIIGDCDEHVDARRALVSSELGKLAIALDTVGLHDVEEKTKCILSNVEQSLPTQTESLEVLLDVDLPTQTESLKVLLDVELPTQTESFLSEVELLSHTDALPTD